MCLISELSFPLETALSLPPSAKSFIICSTANSPVKEAEKSFIPSRLPFENGPPIIAEISSAKLLSEGQDVKTAVELLLDTGEHELSFLPGDTIGILPQNNKDEVDKLLKRLNLNDRNLFKIDIDENSPKKKNGLPPHLPKEASAEFLLTNCLDLRCIVKKTFLRSLIDFTSNEKERRRLAELCSKEGSKEYNVEIINKHSTIIDILESFPSCNPPLCALLEHLPRLLPRPYSIACSPLENNSKLRIVFNVVYDSRNRRGVCSGWLYDLSLPMIDVPTKLSMMNLTESLQSKSVPIYLRKPTNFRIPDCPSVPLIMIGPGTGISPFIGFLEHRRRQLLQSQEETTIKNFKQNNLIFFGCRYPERDELYKNILFRYDEENLCKYFVCYSRDEKTNKKAKYVQDLIKQQRNEIVELLDTSDALLFICGDGLNMGRDVLQELVGSFQTVKGMTETEAQEIVSRLEKDNRILKDLWI